jgi:hypothetical protein
MGIGNDSLIIVNIGGGNERFPTQACGQAAIPSRMPHVTAL